MKTRPDFKYLVASALFGFILGAFVVASLGTPSALRQQAAGIPARVTPHDAANALDDPGSPVLQAATPTTGRSGDPTIAVDAGSLKGRGLIMPVKDVPRRARLFTPGSRTWDWSRTPCAGR